MQNLVPLRVGVVGLSFGSWMVDQLLTGPGSPYFKPVAICDLDPSLVDKVCSSRKLPSSPSLEAMLEDSSIDVIALCTGPSGRGELMRKIIRAGKDVITTKPFELDATEAKSVVAEAIALNRRIVLNSPGPLLPQDLQQIHSWIDAYDLGQPVAARADTWAHYREVYQGSWYDDPARCPLAPVFRLGVYLINDLVEFLGEATEVAILQSQVFTQRPTPDNAQMGILFKNGAIANVFASFCVNDGDLYRNSLTLNFERGTIYRDVGFRKDSPDAELGLVMRVDGDRKCVAKALSHGRSGDYQWKNFYDLFSGDVQALAGSYRKIVAGVEILDLMKKSVLSKSAQCNLELHPQL